MCEVGEKHQANSLYHCKGCNRPMCDLNENEEIYKQECNDNNIKKANNIQNSHKRSNSINYSRGFSKINNNNNQNPSTINFIINNFQNIIPPRQKQFFPQNQMFQTPNLMFQSQPQFFPFQQDMNFPNQQNLSPNPQFLPFQQPMYNPNQQFFPFQKPIYHPQQMIYPPQMLMNPSNFNCYNLFP